VRTCGLLHDSLSKPRIRPAMNPDIPVLLVSCSFGDPRSGRTWSGTPLRIIRCLERQGVRVVAIDSDGTGIEKATLAVLHRLAWMGAAYRRGHLSRERSSRRVEAAALRAGVSHVLHAGSLDVPIARAGRHIRHYLLCDSTWDLWIRHATEVSRMQDRMRRLAEELEREAFSNVEHIFAVSGYVRDNLVSHYGIASDRVTVVGTGCGAIQPYYGPKDYANGHILFAGRGRLADKGCPLLLDAFRLALARRPDLRLILVGSKEYKHVERQLPNVSVKGYVPSAEVEGLFQQAALFAQPAPNEPWGLVYLEALACRTPVLGLNRNALPELTRQGEFGFLVDAAEPRAVADKIVEACANPLRLEAMGRAGQNHCVREFSWERTAERIGAVVFGLTRSEGYAAPSVVSPAAQVAGRAMSPRA
jgi:glycosyltransferase involved in cell wall biosynthesis